MISLSDCKRHDRERRIAGRAGGELAAIRYEQIFDIVGLAEFVHDTVLCFRAHPVRAHVMGAGIRRGRAWGRRGDDRRNGGWQPAYKIYPLLSGRVLRGWYLAAYPRRPATSLP